MQDSARQDTHVFFSIIRSLEIPISFVTRLCPVYDLVVMFYTTEYFLRRSREGNGLMSSCSILAETGIFCGYEWVMMGIGITGNHTFPGWDEESACGFLHSFSRARLRADNDGLRSMIADDTRLASLSEVGVIVCRHCLITRQLITTFNSPPSSSSISG